MNCFSATMKFHLHLADWYHVAQVVCARGTKQLSLPRDNVHPLARLSMKEDINAMRILQSTSQSHRR
jgi:hypothetical protein